MRAFRPILKTNSVRAVVTMNTDMATVPPHWYAGAAVIRSPPRSSDSVMPHIEGLKTWVPS